MAGFDNDTVYGTGIDLSGNTTVANKLNVDGYLYFGNSSGNPGAGLLTSTNDTLTYTGAAGAGRIENRRWLTAFVVDPSASEGERGTYQTIQAAVTAASSGDVIFLRDGTYTENVTLKDGIIITSFDERGGTPPEVVGKFSLSSGTAVLKGLELSTNTDYVISCTGTGTVNAYNCRLNGTDNTLIQNTSSGLVRVERCSINLSADVKVFEASGSGGVFLRYCTGSNTASNTASTHSGTGATVRVEHCNIPFNFSVSSSTGILVSNSTLDCGAINLTCITTAGTATSRITASLLSSGTSSCISVGSGTTVSLGSSVISSSNTNAITGAGTIEYGNVSYNSTSSLINTTTQSPMNETHGPISFDGGSNFLDYYEEGTWTPALTGATSGPTITYTSQVGSYTRIGNLVYVKGLIVINTISGGSGSARMTGLPFTAINETSPHVGCVQFNGVNFDATAAYVTARADQATTYIRFYETIANAAGSVVDISDFANGDNFGVTVIYKVS